ncbi:hypothetical protein J1N35_007161 [Gossypium stocksii]|uniref:RNase H type-1 domain-containing protein n=1 Tax=Gossypium stocksii TaxID=47602 RepID=A0A9D3W705_9ROSI|nr:hypothetical protein J1N35_007161 [Gossypium stocksii]
MSPKDNISSSYSWANHFSSNYNAALEYCPNQSTIPQNSSMCFYLSTDGAAHSVSSFSTAGGLIRDGEGKWIIGYNRYLGKCTAAVVELWGIWDGLLLLQKQGYDEVIIQSDNLENVISICASELDGLESSLIRRNHQILAFEEKCSLNYIPRESNRVADALAKMALMRSGNLQIFEEPPLELQVLLKDECNFDNVTRN